MNTYPVGTPVTVTLPITDEQGTALTPTGLSLAVYDEDENVLYSTSSLTINPGDSELAFVVTGNFNTPANSASIAIRTVELTITTATGTFIQSQSYIVKARSQLTFLKNTFQTMDRAKLTATQLPNLTEWEASNDEDREVALMTAYERLIRFNYRVISPFNGQSMLYSGLNFELSMVDWQLMTSDSFALLPVRFVDSLRKAQVAEANQIMKGVSPDDKRSAGILSESIGESKMMFRVGKPLDLGLSKQAFECLKGYIVVRQRIGRT